MSAHSAAKGSIQGTDTQITDGQFESQYHLHRMRFWQQCGSDTCHGASLMQGKASVFIFESSCHALHVFCLRLLLTNNYHKMINMGWVSTRPFSWRPTEWNLEDQKNVPVFIGFCPMINSVYSTYVIFGTESLAAVWLWSQWFLYYSLHYSIHIILFDFHSLTNHS